MPKRKTNIKKPKRPKQEAVLKNLREEIARLKKELDDKDWADRKTNEGIKILYKELEKRNTELRELDQLKSGFISTVSHELRTPLSVIRENIALIKDGLLGETTSEQRDLLQTTQSNIDRLANILNSLLDISKIESRSLELKRQPVNICEIAHRAVEFLLPKAYSKNIEVETHFPEKIMISADPDQILRVFINLLTNAIKYSNENGTIMVGVEDLKEKGVECFVSDTGIGIAQTDIPKMFERFVRLDKQKENKGAGLGLSISRGIIEMHGGKIWAVSKLGEGSRFIFKLPKGAENE